MKTKNVKLEYGDTMIQVQVPVGADILKAKSPAPLAEPRQTIATQLAQPLGTLPLAKLIARSNKAPSKLTVAIAIADNTRPVPYSSERTDGLLLPLLRCIENAGVLPCNICLIVATGTHVATSQAWKRKHLGREVFGLCRCIDHDCQSSDLVPLGEIQGTRVSINRQFMEADIRIATGLVEPHFMAGASGGRKTICPGLMNLEATNVFHGPEFMDHPHSSNLVLENNPCHEFSLAVARRVNVDFTMNATVNSEGNLTGLFCGELEQAHGEAVNRISGEAIVVAAHEYELVVTTGSKVAVNHYQAAKAACATIPIVRQDGFVVLIAHNGDREPVGKDEYKECLRELMHTRAGQFSARIRERDWQFTPDQWQVQKWDQFFRKIGSFQHLAYCTNNIPRSILAQLPATSGYEFIGKTSSNISAMASGAIAYAAGQAAHEFNCMPRTAVLVDGPYAVPLVR